MVAITGKLSRIVFQSTDGTVRDLAPFLAGPVILGSAEVSTEPRPGPVHLIADGEAVTSCCGRTPFELPRTDRITVDPKLGRGCG